MSDPNIYTVSWICALAAEYITARQFLDEEHKVLENIPVIDTYDFTLGSIGEHNVVIAVLPVGGYGTDSAAALATNMLHSFPNVRLCLMVGIGGGVPSQRHDIRLGDVVVGAPGKENGGVVQYDFGKSIQDQSFTQSGSLNKPPLIILAAVDKMQGHHKYKDDWMKVTINSILEKNPRLRSKYGRPDPSSDRLYKQEVVHPTDEASCTVSCGEDISNLIPRPERAEHRDHPVIHCGLIASANRPMADSLVRDKLAANNDVLCFEMEVAGLKGHFPCLVIRGISDYSDSHRNKEWQGYAAITAAAYATELLRQIPSHRVRLEKRIRDILSDIEKDPLPEPHRATGEGFAALHRHLTSFYHSGEKPETTYSYKIELRAEWEVEQAMRLYKKGTQFRSILAISGNAIDAQAATCDNYLKEHFEIGSTLLDAIQALWDSNTPYEIKATNGNLRHLSVKKHGLGSVIAASGSCGALMEIAHAFAWFCCAIRPALAANLGLSTFKFDIHAGGNQSCTDIRMNLQLLQQRAVDNESCWHGLFKKAVIVLDGPISDRSQFVEFTGSQTNLSAPKGLDIPFDIMVNLAAVDYPFEYDRGIVLKGFNTLLVATAKCVTPSGSAFQWHFVDKGDLSLSKYTDDEKYFTWKEGEEPRPELETVSKAIRTFLGWNDDYQIQLGTVDPLDASVTELRKAGRLLKLKSIGCSAGIVKSPVTLAVTATFEIQEDSVKHSRETKFLDAINSATTNPILLYAPNEGRGWLVPQLWALVSMALIYVRKNQLEPEPPKADVNMMKTRTKLFEGSELKFFPRGVDKEKTEKIAMPLKDLLCDLAQELEWAEEHARRQRKFFFQGDTIYGFEFFELATRQKNYFVKECSIKNTHGDWVDLLDKEAIKGVVFCKGLGEVISCGIGRCLQCSAVPKDHSYLTAVISCLEDLKKYGKLTGVDCWSFRSTAFENCFNCTSCDHRLQSMADTLCPTVTSTDHTSGIVVFGKPLDKPYTASQQKNGVIS